ncbi:hypothetical protein Leryth_020997 [Lithospermum erythrorhizon]|nr:hypothetical protein Leryth_020997 [Lithospermum erythrorhizon]
MKWLRPAKPYFGVIFLQLGYAGMAIIGKSALNKGMSHYTLAVYRNVVATFLFAPLAIIFERTIMQKMTMSICFKILLLGLLEPVIEQNLYYAGMKYTTATFTTSMSNVLPAITFILAWILRLEKVSIEELHSQAKILGTLVTVGGAMVMTLIGGPVLGLPWTHHIDKRQSINNSNVQHWDIIKGALMITAACFCWSCFYILQAIVLKSYQAGLSLTMLVCMAGAVQGSVLTLIMERKDTGIWSLHWDVNLVAYIYGGLICSGGGYYVSGVVMKERGPVFVTAFNPLSMIIVAFVGSFILDEQLHIGRVLGAVVIVFGLYLVIWGKGNDQTSLAESNEPDAIDQPHALNGVQHVCTNQIAGSQTPPSHFV